MNTADELLMYKEAFAELLLLQYGAGCSDTQLRGQAEKFRRMRRERKELDELLDTEAADYRCYDFPQVNHPCIQRVTVDRVNE